VVLKFYFLTHVLKNEVNILVVCSRVDAEEFDDVGVSRKGPQKHDLPVGSLRVRLVGERIKNLFQRHYLFVLDIHRLPHDSISLQLIQKNIICNSTSNLMTN